MIPGATEAMTVIARASMSCHPRTSLQLGTSDLERVLYVDEWCRHGHGDFACVRACHSGGLAIVKLLDGRVALAIEMTGEQGHGDGCAGSVQAFSSLSDLIASGLWDANRPRIVRALLAEAGP